METKRTDSGYGWRDAAAALAGGAAGCAGFVLLCCEPANDGPITWGFILATKVGGIALLLLANWIYKRFVKKGVDDERA